VRIRSTLHHLLDEIHLLTTAFPDLRDAFDADELPIAFILERDFRRSERWLPPSAGPPSTQQRPDHAPVAKESSSASEH
jgi:hypothetical protein